MCITATMIVRTGGSYFRTTVGGFVRPDGPTRAVAVAKAWPIKNDDPVSSDRHLDKAARSRVLNHACVAMQQNQGLAFAVVDVVEATTSHFHELSDGWVVTLRLLRSDAVYERGDRNGCKRLQRLQRPGGQCWRKIEKTFEKVSGPIGGRA
jgi:hypothetical protein